jgi:hypothetical protein
MDLIELAEVYSSNKNQLPINLTNVLKFTTKNVKKGKKKKCSKFCYT